MTQKRITTPSQLRDTLSYDIQTFRAGAKLYVPYGKGYRQVVGFTMDSEGNIIFETVPTKKESNVPEDS